ncbi:NAD(P)-dependent oxidoreductase [Pseudonocardia sp. RS11V-5]|uniref:NAD(P)-dependent oxidoreductase n=1 Tax=Pseudonocardia terrae TaxID=2905831 RepID=UPI001E431B70|nr:NAD(P)-dependent oxidoreductase [Pseudonocardia terrae]MCE3552931.1 NAD(P)-dependent oxidoreductase [Pseudonocardia terrae]
MTAVTVLGTGIMGAGMAANLAKAGLDTTVWNRSPEKAHPLADAGARVAEDPAEAVSGADVIVTMLFDADSVAEVMQRALPAAKAGATWVQTATVGLEGTDRLAALAGEHGVAFVDAPVLGTRQPAEAGQLVVLAGGPQEVRKAVAPVFGAIGSRTVWVGEKPGDGHRLKLVANSWVLSLVTATGQAVALAQALGVDPQQWLDSIAGGPLDSGYAQLKGKAMIAEEFPAAFALDGAVKDSGLIAEALAGNGVSDQLMTAMHDRFAEAAARGHADEDMAAVLHGFRQK